MLKRVVHLVFLIFLLQESATCQDTDAGPGYQMAIMNNPGFTGSEGDGILRLSYINFLPGNNYNLHSVYFSYDSYFPVLHGGAGIYISDEYLGGIVNNVRGGMSYSYFLKAGDDFFINAGLSGSFYHRGFSFGGAILPDQIDPLGGVTLPSSEVLATPGRTIFDVGAGFVFITGNITGGVSVSHLAEPDFSSSGFPDEKLKRKIIINIAGDYNLARDGRLIIRPVAYLGLQEGLFYSGAGAVLESENYSLNAVFIAGNEKERDIRAGFTIGTGKIRFYYNYLFNLASGNKYMPFSLYHQTGIAFSLNNVDKRNTVKTINFPKL